MKESIRQRALDLGFEACRVTSAAPPASARQFQQWLDSGQHGDMAYLARNMEKRLDPGRVLPGARSIVTVAASYWAVSSSQRPPAEMHPSKPALSPTTETGRRPTGLIARYARHTDYHRVLAEPIEQLAVFLDQLGGPDTRSLWYVDTGPLLERDIGQRAGLGFVGKHTNLISRQLGNWFFIGEILTTLPLPPDAPEENRCGSCTRCISACPTRAIPEPFRLDARRCISYLTIELRGSIPVEMRPAIGHRIFGCDDCLEVCPWNRFAREGYVMKRHARADLQMPDLVALLSLDEAGFRRRFADTPLYRARRRGLLRNVCVALGNVGDASVLPALLKASHDSEPLIAEHARWAIERIEQAPAQKSEPQSDGV